MIRPQRVASLAWRDLRQELKGRQGLFVPGVLIALLLPTSLYKQPPPQLGFADVAGDVPAEVLSLPRVRLRPTARATTFQQGDDELVLSGPDLDATIREALDEQQPRGAVAIAWRSPEQQAPHRGLLLALIAASSLTGPVSSSIGTERSRGTLTSLLTAAVTRREIIVGKWLAWAGFGLAATMSFTAVALWRGVVPVGWWLLALATVPMGLTALGLWVVRRATDVVSATATALRLQPAALMVTALAAYVLGDYDPHLGALVPLGGALITSGDVWLEATSTAPLVAAASTLTLTAVLLMLAARDLDESPAEAPLGTGWTGATVAAAAAGLALWTPLVGPELWRQAGNPGLTEELSIGMAALGASAALLGWGLLRAAGHTGPVHTFLDLRRPSPSSLLLAAGAGAALALSSGGFQAFTDATTLLGAISQRLGDTFVPAAVPWWGALALIAAEELLFRGVLVRQVGVVPASTAWAVVKAPLDPFAALVGATTLGAASQAGGVVASLVTRLTAWALVLALPVLPTPAALAIGLAAAIGFGAWLRRAARTTS